MTPYANQKQARKTWINYANAFIAESRKIYEATPQGSIDEVLWTTQILGAIEDLKSRVKTLKTIDK